MNVNDNTCRLADTADIELVNGDITRENLKAYLSAGILSPVEVVVVESLLRNCFQ